VPESKEPDNRLKAGDGILTSTTTVTRFSRQDVLRILRIRAKQLRAWERAALIPASSSYSFQDLVQLRKLRDLRATRLSSASIRAGLDAMQAASGMTNPLLEAGLSRSGSRLVFRHSGSVMEPIAGQFLFDFEKPQQVARVEPAEMGTAQRARRISALFMEAVNYEESGKSNDAHALYQEILSLDPQHAPAAINLGTIFYNLRQFAQSEALYRQAAEADSNYALAFFDLGNALDELQRLPEAILAYQRAIQLSPGYADAHYNLALAFERTNDRRRALGHWMLYLRLDPIGPWANHARGQARKILDREKLSVAWRNAAPVRDLRTAASQKPYLLPRVSSLSKDS
jgi:tetratricopeptide (TPR) repeat protein